jgi:hypothetical protein
MERKQGNQNLNWLGQQNIDFFFKNFDSGPEENSLFLLTWLVSKIRTKAFCVPTAMRWVDVMQVGNPKIGEERWI